MSTRMGFEPTRAEHIGLAVQRLNLGHLVFMEEPVTAVPDYDGTLIKYTTKKFPRRESNPGLLGESQIS